ncbi:MAG TPA: PDZ domain-containing protein [Acidobacteriota bacterium]|nr:PDZ domain-containing protein [Acidobacteriota bacterium]
MKQWKEWLPLLVVVGVVAIASVLVAGRAQAGDGDGWLGVYIQSVDEDLADAEDLESTEGVAITRVIKDSPAEKAGLERGDIILEYDGKKARSVRRLTRMIDLSDPGERIEIVVRRDGKDKTVVVEIGEDDEDLIISDFGDLFIDMPKINMPRIRIPEIDINVPRAPRALRAHRAPRAPSVYSFSTGQLSTAHIGVSLYELSEQLAETYGVKGGALINEVSEDGPAEKAGLKAGDVIVKMDGKRVDDVSEIREAIQDKDEDEKIEVTVLRDGSEKSFDVGIEESYTWSGVGTPKAHSFSWTTHGHDSNDDWDDEDWTEDYRDAMRDYRDSYKESRDDWRKELREAMKELREELDDLREELEDLDDDG